MSVRGYTSTTSVVAGASLNLHLSATSPGRYELSVERHGFERRDRIVSVDVAMQRVPDRSVLSFGWPVTTRLAIPIDWPTGLYVLHARSATGGETNAVLEFVVRPAVPARASGLLLLTDFVTNQAYTVEGGRSIYEDASSVPRVERLSFNRPFVHHPHTTSRELIVWMRDVGYAVEHASMVDLHTNSALLKPYQCIVFGPHAEYWSAEMRDQVERFVREGGNVLSLSGNTCFRQVRFEDAARTLVCYKNAQSDPSDNKWLTTVAFAQPPVHRPPNQMLGVGWTYGGFGLSSGTARIPYRVHFPSHWALAGVALGDQSTLPMNLHYETDATEFVMEDEGYPRVTGAEGTPRSTVVLASADLGEWSPQPGMATATIYVRHGMVFAAGTTEWIPQLAVNPAAARITRNLLDRFRTRRAFAWERIGHANGVRAMTAVEGVLYAATSDKRLWRRHPVLADAGWRLIGHANELTSMAGDRGALFAVDTANVLWRRAPRLDDVPWQALGTGAPGGTRALCASGGVLYAIAADGLLYSRSMFRRGNGGWTRRSLLPANTAIVAMAACHGVLLAVTSTGKLLRTNYDFVAESRYWIDLMTSQVATGLAIVDGMLFGTDRDNGLWWLDLHHHKLNALSPER